MLKSRSKAELGLEDSSIRLADLGLEDLSIRLVEQEVSSIRIVYLDRSISSRSREADAPNGPSGTLSNSRDYDKLGI